MTSLYKALRAFWSQFEDSGEAIPAYFSGYVPNDAAFPYVTYEAVDGEGLSQNVLTAFCWFKAANGYNAREHAAAFMDQVKAIITPRGYKLPLQGGFALIYPNGGTFLSYTEDQADHDIIGARVSYEIHYYQ